MTKLTYEQAKKEFEAEYVVVQEYIIRSILYKINRDGEMTTDEVDEYHDISNQYWAIIQTNEYGCVEEVVEDNFKSADEAWARYDEIMEQNIKSRLAKENGENTIDK